MAIDQSHHAAHSRGVIATVMPIGLVQRLVSAQSINRLFDCDSSLANARQWPTRSVRLYPIVQLLWMLST